MSKRKSSSASRSALEGKRQDAETERPRSAVRRVPVAGRRRGLIIRCAAAGVVLAVGGASFFALRHRSRAPETAAAITAPASSLPPAEQALRGAVARLPRDAVAQRALARYLLHQHRPFEALWHFQVAQELSPADPESSLGVARSLIRAGFPARAASLLKDRLAHAPADLDSRRALAEAYLAMARPQEAIAALSGGGAALATSAPAQLLLGDAHAASGDTEGAETAYRRAVVLEPDDAAGYDRLGGLALAAGRWTAAIQAFTGARERLPGDAAVAGRLGQTYWEAGKRDEAMQLWKQVAASSPPSVSLQVALGKAYQSRRELSEAAAHLMAAVKVDPASREAQLSLAQVMTAQGARASAIYQRGLYYLETDRPEIALAEFRRLEAAAPERVSGPMMVSLAYSRMERMDLAAAEARRALEKHPGEERLRSQLGLDYVLGHNHPAARKLCAEWLRAEPQAAEPYRLLGHMAREEARMAGSLQFYEQALARDPQNPGICFETAKTLGAIAGAESARRAADLARRATELAPGEADAWLQLGYSLRDAGRPDEAADALLRSLDLNPTSAPACSALGTVAARLAQPGLAQFYAALAAELQSRKRASALLMQRLWVHPTDAAARARLADFFLEAGELRRAVYQLEQVTATQPGSGAAGRELALVERLRSLGDFTPGE